MSLFVINRYGGDEDHVSKDEKKHLSDLLKRIEERKRQRASKECTAEVKDSEATDEPQCKKSRKKKDKLIECLITDNIPCNEDIVENEMQKLQKKKKKKRKADQAEACVNNCENKEEISHRKEVDHTTNHTTNHTTKDTKDSDLTGAREESNTSDFQVLGMKTQKKKREVKRVLPHWLTHPEIISVDLNSGPCLGELETILDPKLIETLKSNGIEKLFPVQSRLLSWLHRCNKDREQGWWVRDTCVSAPTGSGKTLAYVLPIVQTLQSRIVPKVRCLIVVPVQELATQVYKVLTTYTLHTDLVVGLLSGASSFEQEQSSIIKKNGSGEYICTVDIVVATPGRLVDHLLKTPGFILTDLRFLVIDEADRSADWLQYIPDPHYHVPRLNLKNMRCSHIPAQKLLFSATLSQDPEKLSRLGLFQPILFTSVLASGKDDDINLDKEIVDFIGRYTSPEELMELAIKCTSELKPVALYHLLTKKDITLKTLVFTNSGETAHRLSVLMQSFFAKKKITIGELSAQLVPKQRENVLRKFATGEIHVLISSDALARGVDIPDVQLVVSYDLPKHIKGYIHRVGRTGRAGKTGTAISILTANQVGKFNHMLNNAHKVVPSIEKVELDILAETLDYQTHVDKLKETLEKDKQDVLQRTKSVKRIRTITAIQT